MKILETKVAKIGLSYFICKTCFTDMLLTSNDTFI